MKNLILTCFTFYIMNLSLEAVVQSVGPGDKVTVDQWGDKFITNKYRTCKSNKICWEKFEDDKIILSEY